MTDPRPGGIDTSFSRSNELIPSSSTVLDTLEVTSWPALVTRLEGRDGYLQLAPNSRRTYSNSFRYIWHWHLLTFGAPLSLPAAADDIKRFVRDHLPSKDGPPEMSADIAAALVQAGVRRDVGRLSGSTIKTHLGAWRALHEIFEQPHFFDMRSVRGEIRRRYQSAPPPKGKAMNPITRDMVNAMRKVCDVHTLRGLRDRALLSAMYATGGRRRSELIQLRCEDVTVLANEHNTPSFSISLAQTKTGHARVSLAGEGAADFALWLRAAGIVGKSAPIFPRIRRGDRIDHAASKGIGDTAVYQIIKDLLVRAGFDPTLYSPHSIRSGFIFDSLQRKIDLVQIAGATTHKSVDSLKTYVERNLAARLGEIHDLL